MTLDVVERALNEAGKASVRFDGNVPQKDRQPLVEKFRNDPGVSVMLLTLSCGAVGCGAPFSHPMIFTNWMLVDSH